MSAEPLTGVKSDHYSYTVYADPAMAEAFDRARFGGPIGELLAETQALARRLAATAGARVEAYRVFSDAQVRRELQRHGFRVTRRHRQFVLPIAFHKRLGSRQLTERVEGALATAGLLAAAGSPVTVLAER